MWNQIFLKLAKIYSKKQAKETVNELKKILYELKTDKFKLSQASIALITYPNTFANTPEKPLQVLTRFIKEFDLHNITPIIHILPFYPWDTDRGFSVTNYYHVEPEYGDWKDISDMGKEVFLMFDFVINHASIENPLVQRALIHRHLDASDVRKKFYENEKDFVIAYYDNEKPSLDALRKLTRPRPNPVLTPYYIVENETGLEALLGKPKKLRRMILGSGWVWTTFSRPKNSNQEETTRQIDLNFRNPKVLIESIKILLFYANSGADIIRLDAIGYIWKKIGSTSLHEKETHILLEIIHDILKIHAPNVLTIAEVNEEQDKILPYLGKKNPEGDLVYQFTHFPLAVYAVLTKDAKPYISWVKTTKIFKGKQFITVLGTHDGMGLKPVKKFLTESQINRLTNRLVSVHYARPNLAILPGGKQIIYEICATPWNLINSPDTKEDFEIQLNRYLAVLALGLAQRGIPAIYVNGLIGTKNYEPEEGLDENRSVNREIFNYDVLSRKIINLDTQEGKVFSAVKNLLTIRANEPAFAPDAPQLTILNLDNKNVIGLSLPSKNGDKIIQLINITDKNQVVGIKTKKISTKIFKDLIGGLSYSLNRKLTLSPYQVLWLK